MRETIRVLQVVTHMNRGGLESMIMNYYRNIDRTRVQFDFLTHRPEGEKKDFDDEILSLGGNIYHISPLNPLSPLYLVELNAFFREHKEYKIIHVHQDCLSGVILKIAKKNGIPVRIAHCHSSSQDKGFKYYLKCIYKKNIKKYATKLFACGQKSGEWMFETKKFEILPNAIDANLYRFSETVRKQVRKELKLEDSFVIGHVGRFSAVKNQSFLINITESLLMSGCNVKTVLVGDGENKDKIQELVKEKKLENTVIFTGQRSDINQLMQAFDVFVLPSLYEGVPVTMVEAQSAGLRCFISSNVPLDCKITENVEQISLEEGADVWAKKIGFVQGEKRIDTYKQIVEANYDIKQNGVILQNYYESKYLEHVQSGG